MRPRAGRDMGEGVGLYSSKVESARPVERYWGTVAHKIDRQNEGGEREEKKKRAGARSHKVQQSQSGRSSNMIQRK